MSSIGRNASISPEKLLEAMRDPREPHRIRDLCAKYGLATASLTYWKKKIPGFKKDYQEALKDMARKRGETPVNKRHPNCVVGWEDSFLETYTTTGRYRYSASMAGVHHTTVDNRLDPLSTTYDPEFAKRFQKADASLNKTLEDVAYKRAIESESDAMIKYLLQARMPEKYARQRIMPGSVHLEFNVLEDRAKQFLAEIFQPVLEAEIVTITPEQKRIPSNL